MLLVALSTMAQGKDPGVSEWAVRFVVDSGDLKQLAVIQGLFGSINAQSWAIDRLPIYLFRSLLFRFGHPRAWGCKKVKTMHISKILTSLLVTAMFVVVAPASAHHTGSSSADYIGGGGIDGASTAVCQSPPSDVPLPVGVGGVCHLDVGNGRTNQITVYDDLHGSYGFYWRCSNQDYSASGDVNYGYGSVSFSATGSYSWCYHVTVWVDVGGVSGRVEVSW